MFTVGCDPEIFLNDGAANPISAHGLVAGTKAKPIPVGTTGGLVQVDGTALEFNTKPFSGYDQNYFQAHLRSVLNGSVGLAKTMHGRKLTISKETTRIYDREYWDKVVPESAKELGCDPDFNAYTGKENPRPDPAKLGLPTMRTAGGHIHIGWDRNLSGPDHMIDCMLITKMMDFCVGQYSDTWDKDEQRRKLYGGLGAFRPKSFGVEYRTLSNAWVTAGNTKLIDNIFFAVRKIYFWVGSNSKESLYTLATAPSFEDVKLICKQTGFSSIDHVWRS